jgi:hypothetical protein
LTESFANAIVKYNNTHLPFFGALYFLYQPLTDFCTITMSASFIYPKTLLHRRIEQQWFPKPDPTPTLTVLEDAEEAHQRTMAKIVSRYKPLVVLGRINNANDGRRRSSTRGGSSGGDASTAADTTAVDDVSTVVQLRSQPPATTTLLWNRDRTSQRR